MISYAQNGEDVVLARLFGERSTGRYVDVGAADAVKDSVTKHFYDLGWRGINVEPIPEHAEKLREARPEDVTLAVALGAAGGTATLHVVEDRSGWSTLDTDLATGYRAEFKVVEIEVEVRTLADVLDEHPGPVDFLKIDVEGAERAVIEGADWARHAPRVVVVEATEPGSPTPNHEGWEPLMLAAGYVFVLFDGLNRFYARESDAEARRVLAAPANVFDEFVPADLVEPVDQRAARVAEVGYIRRMEDALREAQEARVEDAARIEELRAALREAEQQVARSDRRLAALEARLVELENR
ncbi:FkbM family methyltransferase [Actinosynnema sp. NPDC047251]|uniref:Methyltransferase, FkbM family n=1 Tax=Saccharothrix espanaensis (strain ATCC 51144 / DSM 44229 / JCM 9112 / NBRC 15066 / NRRL 15764) TaxID=1179773 RepID=K3W435_SACES|nr:FkbM family methyltransferase [Saccharothrix espanaensis]CCH27398.1 Methyltransferase, FkbM family [Saccharothrix espanaensis DSM 44229]